MFHDYVAPIKSLVESNIANMVEELRIDPSVKEPGHTYCNPCDQYIANLLRTNGYDVINHKDRSLGDIELDEQKVNTKLSFTELGGRPNICSINRMFEHVCSGHDQLWLLMINLPINKKRGQPHLEKSYQSYEEHPKQGYRALAIPMLGKRNQAADGDRDSAEDDRHGDAATAGGR